VFPILLEICWPLAFFLAASFIVLWFWLEKKYNVLIERSKYGDFPCIKDIRVKLKSISDKRIKVYLRVLLFLYYFYIFLFFFPLLMLIVDA
jgi:hypothetical protein